MPPPALAVYCVDCTSSYRIELSLLAFGESAPLDVVLPLLCLVQLKHRRHARVYFLMGEGRDLGNNALKYIINNHINIKIKSKMFFAHLVTISLPRFLNLAHIFIIQN